jgi:hypothetical protein
VPTQAPAPGVPAVHPLHAAQPYVFPHPEQSRPDGVPVHVPGDPHPWQVPQPPAVPHCAQVVYVGVPVHVGPVLKRWGGGSAWASAVAQQIRADPVQSLSDWQGLGHVC